MKVVFCIDDNPRYLLMLRVAVRSLRLLHPDIACVCVYAGDDAGVMDAVRDEGVLLARHRPVLDVSTIPAAFHRCIGCFLKLELALVPELAAESHVLYCDSDVLFRRPLDDLFALRPPYMGMAREDTAPFFHDHAELDYMWRGRRYVVPLPFPIWTYSSGVVLFNLDRLRRHDHVRNFLAFCAGNVQRIGNLDQSLLNYFFGKRITKLEPRWNCPPYRQAALAEGHIIHFHGPKPWDTGQTLWRDLRINHYGVLREEWLGWLTSDERALVREWEASTCEA